MYTVKLSDEDVQFINEAASILMPMYKAQQFLGRLNNQVEESKKAQRAQAEADIEKRIAEGIKGNAVPAKGV